MIYSICSVCTLTVQFLVCEGQALTHRGHDLAILQLSLVVLLHAIEIHGRVIIRRGKTWEFL